MAIEIELKFIVTSQAIAALPEFLARWATVYEGKKTLSNTYYDTDDYFLRKHHMGLRIRAFDNQYEMTLKAEGKVVAGLHQRPEYNISMSEPNLDLSLLPDTIWPDGCNLPELQNQLKPLFSTDYVREKWLITYNNNSEIELALDCGQIKYGKSDEAISEIELELKQGDVSDVIDFAMQFCQLGGLRLSSQSKVTRGYLLAVQDLQAFSIIAAAPKSTVEQAMQHSLDTALSYWQYHEEIWLTGNVAARDSIIYAIAVIRQTWLIWGGMIPRKATADLRARLQEIEQRIQADDDARQVCYQPLYVQTKLALTQWNINKLWLSYIDEADRNKLDGSFKRFADIMLSRAAKTIKTAFSSTLNEQELIDLLPSLNRYIISVKLLAGAYSTHKVGNYLDKWQSVMDAINQKQAMNTKEALIGQALKQPVFWLNSSK